MNTKIRTFSSLTCNSWEKGDVAIVWDIYIFSVAVVLIFILKSQYIIHFEISNNSGKKDIGYLCFQNHIYLKLHLLGWRWSTWTYRFRVWVSVWQDLCIAPCAHLPESDPLLSPQSRPPSPHPLRPHHMLLVSASFRFIPTHEWGHWVSAGSDWLTSLSIMFSRAIHAVANGAVSDFLIAELYSTVCLSQ